MLEALLATIIRPCLGQGSNKSAPMPKDEANELFGTLRAEEILAINTAFREQLRVRRHVLNQTRQRPHLQSWECHESGSDSRHTSFKFHGFR